MADELMPRNEEFGLAKSDQAKAPITNHESASFGKQLLGFWVTFRTMFKKVNTVQYPEVKEPTAERFHGRHQLNRHPDGLEKCIGCELCAWACPADAIYVEGADNKEGEQFSPGERYGKVYQINYFALYFLWPLY